MNDEFYIGWQPNAPPHAGKVVRAVAVTLLVAVVLCAAMLAVSQRLIGRGVFEWGKINDFAGILVATPVPHLVISDSGAIRSLLLVRPWKFGFDAMLAKQLDQQRVTLRGTLIYRDDQTMIEVAPNSVRATSVAATAAGESLADLGEHTFLGEIVDSKCFLGVMNPGQLKPHRACATRCVSGGVPPVLLVREPNNSVRYLLLVSRDGQPVNDRVLDIIAEPVRITGQLVRQGDMLVLRADPATYQRIR